MSDDIQKVVKELGTAFEQFKEANDQRLTEVEKGRGEDPILTEKMAKMDDAIDAAQKRLEAVETLAARKAKFSQDQNELEAKAKYFAELMAKRRNVASIGDFGAQELAEYKSAQVDYIRRAEAASPDSIKRLTVGNDPDGGYLVTPDMNGRIVEKIYETSPMRQVANVMATGSDAVEGLFDLDEAAAVWVEETQARDETDTPQLGRYRIPVHELSAEPRVSQKMLDDSMIDIESWLADKVADRFTRAENAAFVNGTGVTQPRGFLTYPDGTDLPGTIEQIATTEAGGFDEDGDGGDVLMDAIYRMKQAYRAGARWHMPRLVTAEVRKLKDAEGRYLWQPGIAAGQPATLLGFPVLEFEDMPELADGSLSMAFANMGEAYQIVDRIGIRVLRDPYTGKPFVKFYTTKRTGGAVINFEAVKLLRFAAT